MWTTTWNWCAMRRSMTSRFTLHTFIPAVSTSDVRAVLADQLCMRETRVQIARGYLLRLNANIMHRPSPVGSPRRETKNSFPIAVTSRHNLAIFGTEAAQIIEYKYIYENRALHKDRIVDTVSEMDSVYAVARLREVNERPRIPRFQFNSRGYLIVVRDESRKARRRTNRRISMRERAVVNYAA